MDDKKGFKDYLAGLLGERKRKHLSQMANDLISLVYNRLHHFIPNFSRKASQINKRYRNYQ